MYLAYIILILMNYIVVLIYHDKFWLKLNIWLIWFYSLTWMCYEYIDNKIVTFDANIASNQCI